MKQLIVIVGPTGVGKTESCLRIAEHVHTPIINADSRQIFRELPIGTAAPTKAQQKRIFHYFVGTHQIKDYYSASLFETEALQVLSKLFEKQNTALMSGGSMMYIDAVCKGIDKIPTINEATREELKRRLAQEGLHALAEELRKLDPEHYEIVDKNNPRRVIHALEICHQTGRTYTSFRTATIKKRPFHIIKIGLNRPRSEIYQRINQRILHMVQQGLVEEARCVYPLKGLNALNTVGYKELFDFFDGKLTFEQAITKIQSSTRQYMRKQLTWFKKDENIRWFNPDNIEEIINYIDNTI